MILGITGGFGSGKSSVLHFFRTLSYVAMDADSICRELYEQKNPELLKCIKEQCGTSVFLPDGNIDRKKLADKLFIHQEKMDAVTAVIYPLLTEKMIACIDQCRKNGNNGAFEIPLLYEAHFEKYFDAVLAVWTPDELRKKRLTSGRNFSIEEFERRSRMQLSQDEKLERADFGVINSGSIEDLHKQLTLLINSFER